MKKILIMISCIAMIFTTLLLTDNNSVFAANIGDTFTKGDLSYKVIDLGNTTTNGKVTITDFDETSQVTTLTLPATVEQAGKTYDVVSADGNAFEDANKIKTLIVSENFREFDPGQGLGFIKMSNEEINSSLETIIVDEKNPVLKVIDGVVYDMTVGEENFVFFPYNTPRKEFVVPEFLATSTAPHADEFIFLLPGFCPNLEKVVMPFTVDNRYFVENDMVCQWKDDSDHSKGIAVEMIPQAMKKVVLSKNIVDIEHMLGNFGYLYNNKAEEFIVDEKNTTYQSIDGNLYKADTLMLYPGGKKESVYQIPEGTKAIGEAPFLGNRNLKSLIIPNSVDSVANYAFASFSLKSIKIEGEGNITWDADSFTNPLSGDKMYNHIYVDNGNTTAKQKIQAVAPHLTDDYFHEVGAVPTTNISNVKTSIENKKDVKVSWNASTTSDGYEVRRYDHNGTYEVVASTANTSYVDTTTAYNTAYQYEIVPYNLPVTSSNDMEDPLRTYKTVGTASQKVSITTPIQKFQGTYVYKDADGIEVIITKEIEANTSALQQAPTLSEVKGYEFEKWTTDLTNSDKVDKNFTARAVYKTTGSKPGEVIKPEVKPDAPTTPLLKPEDTSGDAPNDNVATGDQTNIGLLTIMLVIAGLTVFVVKKKQNMN